MKMLSATYRDPDWELGDTENELEDLDNGRGRDAVVRDYFS